MENNDIIRPGYSVEVDEAGGYEKLSAAVAEHNAGAQPGENYWGIRMTGGVYSVFECSTVPTPPGEEEQLEALRAEKLTEVSAGCEAAIHAGFDMAWDDGTTEHFSLTPNDQANLSGIFSAVTMGATAYPYHPDGGACRMYSANDIVRLYAGAKNFITKQTTYNNALRRWVRRETDMDVLRGIAYGTALPDDLKAETDALLEQAETALTGIVMTLTGDSGQ